MPNVQIEFSDDTLVLTEHGVERLADLLHRPVLSSLWAVKWCFGNTPNGISFHKSHKSVKQFVDQQIDSVPQGPARLVNVSKHIYDCVNKNGYCWTNLNCFSEAETYEGETWKH